MKDPVIPVKNLHGQKCSVFVPMRTNNFLPATRTVKSVINTVTERMTVRIYVELWRRRVRVASRRCWHGTDPLTSRRRPAWTEHRPALVDDRRLREALSEPPPERALTPSTDQCPAAADR